MPDAPRRPCSYPGGCAELVENGRCAAHKRPDHTRGKTAARGYDAVWKRFREWFLRHYPECADCGHAANEVHHIKKVANRPDLRLVEVNCMALCKICHAIRTARGE